MAARSKLTKQGVRAFLDRPWAELAERKEQHWADVHTADAKATERAAVDMWTVLKAAGAVDEPQLRDDDLAAHVKLRELIDRARAAIESRRGGAR